MPILHSKRMLHSRGNVPCQNWGSQNFKLSIFRIQGEDVFALLLKQIKTSKEKIIPVETLASPTRKEPSINKKIHMVGKKTCPFLLSSKCFHPLLDAEPWFLCSRRLERREGNICISPRSVTGTSIIAGTMGSAQARLARASPLQRSQIYFCPGLERVAEIR